MYRFLLCFFCYLMLFACKKPPQEEFYTLHPSLNEQAYSYWVDDTILVINNHALYRLDVDKDGHSDLEFSLKDTMSNNLQKNDFWIHPLQSDWQWHSDWTYDDICQDTIYIQHYNFYTYRQYSCDNNEPMRRDSANYATLSDWSFLSENVPTFNNAEHDSLLLYAKHYYMPTLGPDVVSYDLKRGSLRNRPSGYICLKKDTKHYAVRVLWERPYFIIQDIRIF